MSCESSTTAKNMMRHVDAMPCAICEMIARWERSARRRFYDAEQETNQTGSHVQRFTSNQ